MLAQGIIHGIQKHKKGENVVIKLDMAKAYNRVSWLHLGIVLRHTGFCEVFNDMVWETIASNSYYIIVLHYHK